MLGRSSRPEDTGKLRKERSSAKLNKNTKLHQHPERMKPINDNRESSI